LATFLVALGVLGAFDPSVAGYQLVEHADWLPSAGVSYLVGRRRVQHLDGRAHRVHDPGGDRLVVGRDHRVRLFMALTLLLETAIVGSFLALDLLLFFVFFEALLVPMFLVIGMWGSSRRVYASLKFFLYTMAGSAFLLLGIVYLWFQTVPAARHASFDIRQMERLSLATTTQRWLFLAFFVAFAVKVPIFPLHTWLPTRTQRRRRTARSSWPRCS
jgi:NADH-quinone oxidoreductase subunit M